MEIVIDIDEDDYKVFVRQRCNDATQICRLYKAIKNGTILQKGHGRIIDESCIPMEDNFKGVRCDGDGTKTVMVDRAYFPFMTPTIIPEDSDDDSWKSRSNEYFEYKIVKDGETLVTGLRSLEQARTWVSSHGDPEDYLIYLVRVTKERIDR